MFLMFLHSAVIYSLCYTSPCIALSLCALSRTPCTSSGTTGLHFKRKLDPQMLPFLLGRPFLWKNSPPSHLLPLSHWTGTSGIVASAILTWQASRSCFLATWSRDSSLIHKHSLIQYVKPVKLARCMQIPSPFRPPELQNRSNSSTAMSMAL